MQHPNFEPQYRADIGGLVAELQRAHGSNALDFAVETARQHLQLSAWKNGALWLQIVNHLNAGAPSACSLS